MMDGPAGAGEREWLRATKKEKKKERQKKRHVRRSSGVKPKRRI